ncbi:MAG TPA: L-histidine N(alpha)-methyltransferase [Planctomycetota bacterium]|nr:L-histidine N(alpha)-methyltransferase [Planctomycetota bacterium]
MDPIHDATWQYAHSSHIAREYDEYFAELPLFRFDTELLDRTLTRPGRVIDLGCGTGRHVVHLARRGFEVVGVDLSPFMLDVAREKLKRESLKAQLVHGSFARLSDFVDRSFRYAICMFSTLGLIRGKENRAAFLDEVRRILEPGGLFVTHVHNRFNKLWSREGRIWLTKTYLGRAFSGLEVGDVIGEYRGLPEMYLHLFSLGELKGLVRASGMTLEELVPLNRGRSGPLRTRFLVSLRGNGFLAVARR